MLKILLFLIIAALLLVPVLLAFGSAIIFGLWKFVTYETRFQRFFVKYDNPDIAGMVASGKIWTGQTSDQLRDAKGLPAQIEHADGHYIWVYEGTILLPRGMRVMLVNDRVANWS